MGLVSAFDMEVRMLPDARNPWAVHYGFLVVRGSTVSGGILGSRGEPAAVCHPMSGFCMESGGNSEAAHEAGRVAVRWVPRPWVLPSGPTALIARNTLMDEIGNRMIRDWLGERFFHWG